MSAVLEELRLAPLDPQAGGRDCALPGWAIDALRPRPQWPENDRRWVLEAHAAGEIGRFGPCSAALVAIVRDQLAPAVIGLPLVDGLHLESGDLVGRLRFGPHFGAAWAAMDLALCDLQSRVTGVPIGGGSVDGDGRSIAAYASLLAVDVEHPLAPDIAAWCAQQGFVGAKLSLSTTGCLRSWHAALEPIAHALRRRCALYVDAGGRIDPDALPELSRALGELGVSWIEEPCSPPSRAAGRCRITVAAGEHAVDEPEFETLQAIPEFAVWQPEVSWHGPLRRSTARAEAMAASGRRVLPHGGHLPAALALAAATRPGIVERIEFNACLEPARHAYLDAPPTPAAGRFAMPTAQLGLGATYRTTGGSELL